MPKGTTNTKVNKSHSTITKTSASLLKYINKIPEVEKVSIGIITHIRGGRKDLKFLPITGGIKASVRGDGAVQEIYIYTSNPANTEKELLKIFSLSVQDKKKWF